MTTCCWKFWKFRLNLNRTRLHKIRRLPARIGTSSHRTSSRRTRNSQFIEKHNPCSHFCSSIAMHAESQQKVDIKLSKICQSHQKLSEWRKVASRFTVKTTHENIGVVSSYLPGYLSTSWILLNKGQPATEFQWHRCWLLQTVPEFADFAGFVGVEKWKLHG